MTNLFLFYFLNLARLFDDEKTIFFFLGVGGQVSQAKVWRNDIPDITRANNTHTDKIWND